ncbi:MAG TPA: DUF1080 domain-containing protein [Pirellulales bacterium]|nr:DUF1080 domain-containing protein [Pirellulales bacterium]
MAKSCLILAVFALTSIAAVAATEQGFKPLFDGKSLDGWVQRGGKATYEVVDGTIRGTTAPNTPNSFLCTDRDYANFILELQFKVDDGLNSGVQIRSQCFDEDKTLDAKNPKGKPIKVAAGRVHGYQVEIDTNDRAWSGGIYDEGRRGWLNTLAENDAARKAFKHNEWNDFRIECRGDSIKTWINGVPAADLKDDLTPSGFIALQVHSSKSPTPLHVQWRDIRIKEL